MKRACGKERGGEIQSKEDRAEKEEGSGEQRQGEREEKEEISGRKNRERVMRCQRGERSKRMGLETEDRGKRE